MPEEDANLIIKLIRTARPDSVPLQKQENAIIEWIQYQHSLKKI